MTLANNLQPSITKAVTAYSALQPVHLAKTGCHAKPFDEISCVCVATAVPASKKPRRERQGLMIFNGLR